MGDQVITTQYAVTKPERTFLKRRVGYQLKPVRSCQQPPSGSRAHVASVRLQYCAMQDSHFGRFVRLDLISIRVSLINPCHYSLP